IKVVFLENADAAQLLPVLQQLVGQAPDQPQATQLTRAGSGLSANGGAGGSRGGNTSLSQPVMAQAPVSAGGGGGGGGG
ncbi:hypothetical protein, partial [Clostridium perfringens]